MNEMNENLNNTEIVIPEGSELIDEVFYVWKSRYGLFSTMTKEGRKMITGLTKDSVIVMTRWHLKCLQEGTLDDHTYVTSVSMGVKL